VGVIICFEIHAFLNKPQVKINSPRLLVVRRALQEGHPISFLDLTLGNESGPIPAGVLTDQDLALIKGATTNRSLASGEYLTLTSLNLSPMLAGLGRSIPKGLKAYPILASNGRYIRPRDRVDVLLTPLSRSDIPITLVEGVLVLQSSAKHELHQVILALSSREIRVLEKAKQKGKLTLILRSREDEPLNNKRRSNDRILKRRVTAPKIEILSEEE